MSTNNCIFIETGQCGNQLGYSLLDTLYKHLNIIETKKDMIYDNYDDNSLLLDNYFRLPSINNDNRNNSTKYIARAICLDTEPKVVKQCLEKSLKSKSNWRLDPKNICYRHGGAGNNWALGYQMASGEFLQKSIDLISKELEYCDCSKTLVTIHSVAGGTGSGLGTRITEACEDEFPNLTRLNVAISPYHFGEVVVQHYNTILCLSKVAASSHGVLVFENETAQMLCKTMRNIAHPSLQELNETIVSNICPLFLPKYQSTSTINTSSNITSNSNNTSKQQYYRQSCSIADDIIHLCSHPSYKFIDVKVTPQTSNHSKSFTYDSWFTLLKTIQQMQLSGSASERYIASNLKHSLDFIATATTTNTELYSVLSSHTRSPTRDSTIAAVRPYSSTTATTAISPSSLILSNVIESTRSTSSSNNHHHHLNNNTTNNISYSNTTSDNTNSTNKAYMKSLASIITLHGSEAEVYDTGMKLKHKNRASNYNSSTQLHNNNNSLSSSSSNPYYSKQLQHHIANTNSSSNSNSSNSIPKQEQELRFSDLYYHSHSPLILSSGMHSPIQVYESSILLNNYQRAITSISNSQSILPLLQRASREGSKLYRANAYVHQYNTYGIECEDLEYAFRSVGSFIQSYSQL